MGYLVCGEVDCVGGDGFDWEEIDGERNKGEDVGGVSETAPAAELYMQIPEVHRANAAMPDV
jgi:hypothetical protein